MKIFKFGGSSVATPERIAVIIDLLISRASADNCRAVVFSAFQGVTDQLIMLGKLASAGKPEYTDLVKDLEKRHLEAVRHLVDIHQQSNALAQTKMLINDLEDVLQGTFLVKELTPRTLDFIMSFGERLSCLIISRALASRGVSNEFLDARQLIKTDDHFGSAAVLYDETNRNIREYFNVHPVLQITTGFIASTNSDETTTMGRGGSDFTASILGAALDAEEVQIWTDVDGVLTADPRKVARAFPVSSITYEEALEMSHFGAKVIYPPTIQPLMSRGIPIRIKNTFNPDGTGTIISTNPEPSTYAIKGISSIDDVALITVQGSGLVGVAGVAKRIFGTMAENQISVILISQASSEHSVCFAVLPDVAGKAQKLLLSEFEYEISMKRVSEITVERNLCILAVVGENMRHTPGIAGKVFQALGQNGVNIVAIAQGSSELNISAVLAKPDEQKALVAIHDAFFLSGLKTLNIYLVGTGLIGTTLIDMIRKQRNYLIDEHMLDLRVVGTANSRRMYFDLNGIDIDGWKEKMMDAGGTMNLEAFIAHMHELNLPNSIFLDCTSSEDVSRHYLEILGRSVSVVTPNKKANSSAMEYYRNLRQTAVRNNVKFLYETNVGAGLPVVRTIRDMVSSGDEIFKIEGILSGTISFLLNTFKEGVRFSEVVLQAREMGYTEPDPRDDLNGMDVARKILILAREAGLSMELSDIHIEKMLPDKFFKAPSVDAFLKMLPEIDAEMEKRRQSAAKKGCKLRYIARVNAGKATTTLAEVDATHPTYNLSGSDNLIMVNSRCYSDRALVVLGPGAGPEVTASGVLADIIRVSGS